MLSNILTWVGAVLGIAILLAMASGSVALDFVDARGWRGGKHEDRGPRPASDGVTAAGPRGTTPPH